MGFGGLCPGARTFGGARPRLAYILDSLNRQRGTAYDTSITSNVWPINMAKARAIAQSWATNGRASNQFDPGRTSDMLPRWEAAFGIVPSPSDSPVTRRKRLSAIWKRFGGSSNDQGVADDIAAAIGPVFVGLTFISAASATVYWPAGSTLPDVAWYSTAAHILVHVQPLAGMGDGDFYKSLDPLQPLLDAILPAWCTWDWFVFDGTHHAMGFWLDPSGGNHNLDWSAFDV